MGIPVETRRTRIRVPKGGAKANDVSRFIASIEALYRIAGAVEISEGRPFFRGRLRDIPDDLTLKLVAFHFGSDGSGDWFGIAKALKVALETIRDWRQRREQQRLATDVKHEQKKQEV